MNSTKNNNIISRKKQLQKWKLKYSFEVYLRPSVWRKYNKSQEIKKSQNTKKSSNQSIAITTQSYLSDSKLKYCINSTIQSQIFKTNSIRLSQRHNKTNLSIISKRTSRTKTINNSEEDFNQPKWRRRISKNYGYQNRNVLQIQSFLQQKTSNKNVTMELQRHKQQIQEKEKEKEQILQTISFSTNNQKQQQKQQVSFLQKHIQNNVQNNVQNNFQNNLQNKKQQIIFDTNLDGNNNQIQIVQSAQPIQQNQLVQTVFGIIQPICKIQQDQPVQIIQATQTIKTEIVQQVQNIENLQQKIQQNNHQAPIQNQTPIIQELNLPRGVKQSKKLLLSPISPKCRYVCTFKISKIGFKPTFLLYSSQSKLLLSAQYQVLSIGQPSQKNDVHYLGQLKGSQKQTCYSLYDTSHKKRLVGNILLQKNDSKQSVNIIIPKNQQQNKVLREQINTLEQLEKQLPQSTINMHCRSQIQQSNQSTIRNSCFVIKTLSKSAIPKSFIRNKITIESNQYKQSILVRKIQNNLFEVSISAPLSIFQAFGILVSKPFQFSEM